MKKTIYLSLLIAILLCNKSMAEMRYDSVSKRIEIDQFNYDLEFFSYGATLVGGADNIFTVESLRINDAESSSQEENAPGYSSPDPGVFNSTTKILFLPKVDVNGTGYYGKFILIDGNHFHKGSRLRLIDARISSSIEIRWDKQFLDRDYSEFVGLTVTSDNNILVFGNSSSITPPPEINIGYKDQVLATKIDADGNEEKEWEKKILGFLGNKRTLHHVISLPNGETLLGGSFSSEPAINGVLVTKSIFILKVDQEAGVIWETFGLPQVVVSRGSDAPIIGIIKTEEGNDSYYALIRSIEPNDLLVVKINSSGEIEWTKSYYHPETKRYFNRITSSSTGGFILSTEGRGVELEEKNFRQYDQDGKFIKDFRYDYNGAYSISAMQPSSQGGFFISVKISNDNPNVVVKTNNDGSIQWRAFILPHFGEGSFSFLRGMMSLNNILELPNGQLIVTGYEAVGNLPRLYDYYGVIVKLDSDGTVLWSKREKKMINDIAHLGKGRYAVVGELDYGFLPRATEIPDSNLHFSIFSE